MPLPLLGSIFLGMTGANMLGSLFNSGMQYALNSASTAQQYKYNTKLAEQQQKYTQENMALGNQYTRDLTRDSPVLQREGLEAAGLNTALLNGGTFGTAGQSPSPSAGLPSSSALPVSVGSLEGAASLYNMINQAEKTKAETKNIEIENRHKDALLNAEVAYKQSLQSLNAINAHVSEQSIQNLRADYELKQATTIKTLTDAQVEVEQLYLNASNTSLGWEHLSLDQKLTAAQIYKLQTDGALNTAQAQLCIKRVDEIDENIKVLSSQIKINDEQVNYLKAKSLNINSDTELKNFRNSVNSYIDAAHLGESEQKAAHALADKLESEVSKNYSEVTKNYTQSVEHGVNAAAKVSSETRKWLTPGGWLFGN